MKANLNDDERREKILEMACNSINGFALSVAALDGAANGEEHPKVGTELLMDSYFNMLVLIGKSMAAQCKNDEMSRSDFFPYALRVSTGVMSSMLESYYTHKAGDLKV